MMKSDDWKYAIGIIKFQAVLEAADELTGIKVTERVPAYFTGPLCQAARRLLVISQDDLRLLAGVSRKTINDFENGLGKPSPAILSDLVSALEQAGARFSSDEGCIAVSVVLNRGRLLERSRAARAPGSSRRSVAGRAVSIDVPRPAPRGRGRPRKES